MSFVVLLILAVTLIYLLDHYLLNYWTRRGVKQYNTSFLVGSLKDLVLGKESIPTLFQKVYEATKHEAFYGFYMSYRPTLIINDPKLLNNILVKDFQYFHDRGTYADNKNDPLSQHLFSIEGQKWRELRVKLSPTFTSGKLKGMFPTLLECAERLQKFLGAEYDKGSIDIRDLLARLNTDIIGSVAFGLEVDSINNPDNEFREMGRKFFGNGFMQRIRILNVILLGKSMFSKVFKLKLVPDDLEKFFMGAIKQTVDYREQNNIERKDFMQLLLQLKNIGYCPVDKGDEIDSVDSKPTDIRKINFEELCAQAFVFFAAGFETSSTTMSYCLFELAKNKDIQRKVQKEIDEKLLNSDNELEITYDKLSEMNYLECCINETLRMYSAIPMLNREASQDYTIPGTKVVIQKGTFLIIPVHGIQNDSKYFPNPDQFNPDRFKMSINDINKDGIVYMPFGDGPRICIGIRMGKVMTKLGLISLLSKFNIELADNTDPDMKFDKRSFVSAPENPIYLKLTKR